ncbi:MAG: hypothetical protein Q9221_006225 [Calogaya cf. arnoldii]
MPAIYGDTTNEGSVFVPRSMDTIAMSKDWLQAQFPALNAAQKTCFVIKYAYPVDKPVSTGKNGMFWFGTANAYGELRYICPGLFLNNAYARHGVKSNWNYRYAVLDPGQADGGIGIPHFAKLNAIWGAPLGSPPSYKTTNKNMIPVLQHYWISFILDFDPNMHRSPGTPRWEEWGVTGFGDSNRAGRRRIVFRNQNGKSAQMQEVWHEQWERCKTLSEWGVGLGQ